MTGGGPLLPGTIGLSADVIARKQNPASYVVWKDGSLYRADSMIGTPDYSNADAASLLQTLFNYLASVPAPSPLPPGGIGQGAQFKIEFATGSFYFAAPVTINFPGGGSANALTLWGQGQDKTNLILNNGVNDDMFKIIGLGDKLEIGFMKIFGNKTNQTGTSNGINLARTGGEINMYSVEMRDWLNACLLVNSTGNQNWYNIDSCWFLNSANGIRVLTTNNDWTIATCKFENCTSAAISVEAGNGSLYIIEGNRFGLAASANVLFSSGTTSKIAFVGNIVSQFIGTGIAGLQISGNGLASLSDFKAIITSNIFVTTNAGATAIYLGDYVDGIRIGGNRFSGYTDPFNIINTHPKTVTYIDSNMGLPAKYSGWGVTTPSVPSTGVDQQNTNPFPVKIFISGVGSGITAYGITDGLGTLNSFTTTVNLGSIFEIPPYGKIRLTYTGSPTWLWFGTGNGGGV